jgi:crotonobetainyl-CoA:carnitine CoA-transferase CaiB-like acyl-CoA transferase
VGRLYDARDILEDPHYRARGMFETVEAGGRPLKIPALVPKLSQTPGGTEWPGPEVSAHTQEVLSSLLGMTSEEIARLQREGVI